MTSPIVCQQTHSFSVNRFTETYVSIIGEHMSLSTGPTQRCWLWVSASLLIAALSGCAAGENQPTVRGDGGGVFDRTTPPTNDIDTGDGPAGVSEPSQADNTGPLGGRATYEGDAAGRYVPEGLSVAFRYFSATVGLIVDFRDDYVWGVVRDGRDTITNDQVFEELRLQPAALSETEVDFTDSVTGLVNGGVVAGSWRGQFLGSGTSPADPWNSVRGTFRTQRAADGGEVLTGSFSGSYQGQTNRTVTALNGLSATLRSRVVYRMARTAWTDAVSTADAADTSGSDAAGNTWNTGVTQSSRNRDGGEDTVNNRAINARYDSDELVFERINLSSSSRATLATSTEPELPGYRAAISPILGSPNWKGVEYLYANSSKRWNYSIFVSDIEDNDDTDYLAGGFWVWLTDLDDPADPRSVSFAAAASGNDPFQVTRIPSLDGRTTYVGDAAGLYTSKGETPAFRYFNADVRLTAEFDGTYNTIWGVVTEGRDTATNEPLFEALTLLPANIRDSGAAFFESRVAGVIAGKQFQGDWGGQFFGNGASATDLPGSVAGTFGTRSYDDNEESLVGFFGAYNQDLTRLRAGHGLAAGKIIVQPGDSDERGEVVVSCPSSGRVCLVTVEEDGTAFYDRNGGLPDLASVAGIHWQDNPTAEDLLDHWNGTETLPQALGLSTINDADLTARRSTLGTLLEAAEDDQVERGTRLRNTRAEDLEIIGESDGITYGQWKGGPAGTLNIEFDWHFGSNFDPAVQARMERAGKSWSWRILDDFGRHVAERGTEIRINSTESVVLNEDETADDLLILVKDKGDARSSTAGAREKESSAEDYEPWLGLIRLSRKHINRTDVMAHEIGHVLGLSSPDFPSKNRYLNQEDHTFEGPEAMRANDGAAVPFQWRKDDETVKAQTAGAEVDYGHLGVCGSVMAYCSDGTVTYRPSELDFAFLDDIGYDLLDAETASEPELYGYGAWGQYSAWGTGVERTIHYHREGREVVARDTLRAAADAFGIAPSTGFGEWHAPLSVSPDGIGTTPQGSMTWSGSLIGVDLGQAMLPPVFGDAELSVELSTLAGTAVFDDLTVHLEGVSSDFRASRLEYAIDITGNSFSDGDGRLQGGFFGPAHEEMAGVLDDRTPSVSLLAGFGGKR